jgi:hypothetical protein
MPEGEGEIVEGFVMIIAVERVDFVINIGDEKVHPAVVVEIGGIDAPCRSAACRQRCTRLRRESDFFETVRYRDSRRKSSPPCRCHE